MPAELPLVSCIMPTADRRRFVPLALRYFEAQDYPNRELIVLDDGRDSVAGLMPDSSRVRYIRLDARRSLGEKRNRCIEAASGDLIMHWDDDDWMAPHRISYQVNELQHAGADLCGLREMLFHDIARDQTWLYRFQGQRFWLAGGSLLYKRDVWRHRPFPAVASGEDTRFVFQQTPAKGLALPDHHFYVAMIHGGNTSPKLLDGRQWSRWDGDLASVMGGDLNSYHQAAAHATRLSTSPAPVRLAAAEAAIPASEPQCPRVTIGVYVDGEPQRLDLTLASLQRHAARATVILLPDCDDEQLTTDLAARLPGLKQLPGRSGGPAAFNRLLEFDRSDVSVFLESGTRVTDGWLERLLAALTSDDTAGLAGPSTNFAWNEQSQPGAPAPAASTAGIDAYAQTLSARMGDSITTLAPLYSLGDFCLAVKRSLADAIGGADEAYGLGPCWEMDYSIRAARAGFAGVWVKGAYVHRNLHSSRRARNESVHFNASKQRYQDKFCGLRLRGEKRDYEPHCLGDACCHFAPSDLIQLSLQAQAPAPLDRPGGQQIGIAASAGPQESRSRLPAALPPAMPLISCIMPTFNRRPFLRLALACFLSQDYPNKELIVVDDGTDSVADVFRGIDGVRYLHCDRRTSIGAKRNLACREARGEIIVHWDDDDWYGPHRLSYQAAPILDGVADLTGLQSQMLQLPQGSFWTVRPDLHNRMFTGDVHGGTIAYKRQLLSEGICYPDISLAEDAALIRQALNQGKRLQRLANDGTFVYVRHGKNAWSFVSGRFLDPAGWLSGPKPPGFSFNLLASYQSAAAMLASPSPA